MSTHPNVAALDQLITAWRNGDAVAESGDFEGWSGLAAFLAFRGVLAIDALTDAQLDAATGRSEYRYDAEANEELPEDVRYEPHEVRAALRRLATGEEPRNG